MKRFLLASFLGLALFGLTKAASAATLSVSPASGSVTAGGTINVDVNLDTQGAGIDGVDLYFLRFNPSILQVVDDNPSMSGVQITPGTLLPNTLSNTVDNSTGRITFSQVVTSGTTFTGSGKLATIHFSAPFNGTSAVTFDFTLGSTSDTNVAGSGTDKLTAVTNGSYTVTGGTVNPNPPPPTPTPTPTPTPPPGGGQTVTADMYPSSLFFKYANNATVYILDTNRVAHPITDWTVYLNNVPPTRHIVTIPSSIQFTVGSFATLRPGALIKAVNDPTIYLIVGNTKRPFSSEQEFLGNNYLYSQVYVINDINLVADMPLNTDPFVRPTGTWFKYANDPTIFFLNSARLKRPFTTWTMYNLWVDNPAHVLVVPDTETYADGPIVIFPDAVLVKGSGPTVYLTRDGQLRPFTNYGLFQAMGFKDGDIIRVEDSDLPLEPTGDIVQ